MCPISCLCLVIGQNDKKTNSIHGTRVVLFDVRSPGPDHVVLRALELICVRNVEEYEDVGERSSRVL